MPVDRFFIDEPLHEGEMVTLQGDEFQHMSRALRKKSGEVVELINGKGDLAEGSIVEILKNNALITLKRVSHEEKKKERIILVQAIPRINRLDTIIEKVTELGCTDIHLFPGDLSERKDLSQSSMERVHKITQSALKQSGRLYLPFVKLFSSLSLSLPDNCSLFFGDTSQDAPLLIDAYKNDSLALVIGPESGLSESEEKLLREKGIGIKLSDAILRTDTAPIVAIGIISHLMQRKKQ